MIVCYCALKKDQKLLLIFDAQQSHIIANVLFVRNCVLFEQNILVYVFLRCIFEITVTGTLH